MKIKRFLSAILIVGMLSTIFVLPASASMVASGTCGDNLTWVLDSDGTLTIYGTGAMNWLYPVDVPWRSIRDNIKNVVISNGVTNIGTGAFDGCKNLTSITIPDSVSIINNQAFSDCSGLNSITIPDNVTSIGRYAFNWCTGLTSLIIPSGVEIGDYSFYNCQRLTSVTIQNGVTWIGNWAFADCSGLTEITIPNSVQYLGESAFRRCVNLMNVTLLERSIIIRNDTFSGCIGLKSITIPNSVTQIGDLAFASCSSLTDVYFKGTSSEWSSINISTVESYGNNNNYLTNANIHYLVDNTVFASPTTDSWNYTYGGEYHYWKMTPSQTATYVFESTLSSGDSYGYLYDSNFNEITKNDDGGDGNNFKISYNLTAGTTYYYGVRWYGSSTTGTIPVKLTKAASNYTVTYNYSQNGGTSATKTSASVAEGSNADLSVTATKSGWEFVGWNTNANATTALSSYTVTGNVTLYAIYKKTLTAEFYSRNNQLQMSQTLYMYNNDAETSFTFPTPTAYSGWTAVGWRSDTSAGNSQYASNASGEISQTTKFYALYSRTLTLSYNANGGSSTPSNQTATQYYNAYGNKQSKSFTLASAISRSGYNFDKWAKESATGTKYSAGSSITITDNTTMYATWTEIQSVATPTISVSNITGGKQVTISCSTSGATIYYTTDGSTPTTSSSVYSSAISFTTTGSRTIKALAVKSGYTNSSVANQSMTVSQVSTPTASLSSGTITSATNVTLSCSTSGATIYYTTNGNTPTTSSTKYTGAININSTTTLKAIAVVSGYVNSSVATYNYTYTGSVATPVISVSNVSGGKKATITCSTSGSDIYYTTDGTTPTTSSTKYTSAISFTTEGTRTVKAIAVKSGYTNSSVVSQSVSVSKVAAPIASVQSGTITASTNVTLSCSTSGATIYYATNGNTPTTSSTIYTGAITINSTTTLKAIAVVSGYVNSSVATYSYTYQEPVIEAPTVTTNDAANITKNTAVFSGTVTDNGGSNNLTLQFVYWNKYDQSSKYTMNAGNDFKATVKNLSPDSEYYYYAKATNESGSGTGIVKSFKTTSEDVPQSISVSPTYVSIAAGDTYQLTASVLPATATNRNVVWSSSDTSIAKVDNNGMVTAVKQGTAAITATTEIGRLKSSCTVNVTDSFINGTFDFSEWNMATNTSSYAIDGFDWDTPIDGGNYEIATAYLTRWDGAILENNDKYPSYNGNSQSLYYEKNSDYHVQEVIWIPERESYNDNSEIKNAIMNYGALYTSFIVNWSYFDDNDKNYYYPESGYGSNGGHAVAIVGWDDNYPASNFTIAPPGNGAFICKNSWGTHSGENGYFYISYYDKYVGKRGGSAAVTSLERNTNYNKIYQYDPLGACSWWDYDTASIYAANVFPEKGKTLASSELLRAVSFYTYYKNTSYQVYIINDYKNSSSFKNYGTPCAEGTIENAGYHTIKLNSDITLKSGSRFAVIVKLTTPGEYSKFYVEYPFYDYSSHAKANSDESYISSDGKNWADLTSMWENTNCCIKAFTDNGYASQSAKLFSAIDNDNRFYESDKIYTLEEVLDGGIEINQEFVDYVKGKKHSVELFSADNVSDDERAFGALPNIIEFGTNTVSFTEGTILPAKYDLRTLKEVTDVRDQGSWGTCWAHAMYASLESNLLKKAKTVNRSSLGATAPNDYIATVNQTGIMPTSISFENEVEVIAINSTYHLYANITPENATEKSLIWRSDNESVATVDTNGVVSAHSIGTATITATTSNGECSTSCMIQVENGEAVNNVTLKLNAITRSVGDKFLLDYTVNPSTAINKNVTWESSNPNIVSVNENGLLTALSIGTATITITTADGGKTDTITVNINDGMDFEIIDLTPSFSSHQQHLFGSITATIENRTGDKKTSTILLGVYDADDKLVLSQIKSYDFNAGNNEVRFNNLFLDDAVNKGYYIKCFVWDINSIKPEATAITSDIE